MTKQLTPKQAYDLIKSQDNLIFKVKFVKKDGTIRDMNARLKVKKYLKGGSLSYDPASKGYVIAYDMQKEGYRTINTNSLIALKAEGNTYVIN